MTYDRDTQLSMSALKSDVVRICSRLIQFDTTTSSGTERLAAEYVAEELDVIGLEPIVIEAEKDRTNLVLRLPGRDPSAEAILIHAHLDVVPFDASEWRYSPLSGEIAEGCIWGRGAVDMKDMVAMLVTAVRELYRRGVSPQRDIVLAFVSDEEAGGSLGAQVLARDHRELFDGVTVALGELGGFSVDVAQSRLYLLETAQKGAFSLELEVPGRAGHGSMLNDRNPIERLVEILRKISDHQFDTTILASNATLFATLEELSGTPIDPTDINALTNLLGPTARMIGASVRDTVNPTIVTGGYKTNVVPSSAGAVVDCRFLPGHRESMESALRSYIPDDVSVTVTEYGTGHENVAPSWLTRGLTEALRRHDDAAVLSPMCIPGTTDARSFVPLGIRCFGFVPLKLPHGFDFAGMFHGVDERVPIDALEFGASVLVDCLAQL